ncbi:MAG TPA: hypothetical protein VGC86_11855 [Afipia sp.]
MVDGVSSVLSGGSRISADIRAVETSGTALQNHGTSASADGTAHARAARPDSQQSGRIAMESSQLNSVFASLIAERRTAAAPPAAPQQAPQKTDENLISKMYQQF